MKKHAIIPIFIPHRGCPHDCVFCNQRRITAHAAPMTPEDVANTIDTWLTTLADVPAVGVAFYGGSFTAIPAEEQSAYLAVARSYKDKALIDSIHLSTRPDYIDRPTLDNLKRYGVDVIELGVQSFDEDVLRQSGRGHDSACVYEAGKLIQSYGFQLGIQLMIGLPGDTMETCLHSARETVKIAPDIARLYPTIVIRDTALYDMCSAGKYQALSLEEAVRRTAAMYRILTDADINVIRVGLKSSDIINEKDATIGDTFHPAFRQLVEGQIAREDIEAQVEALLAGLSGNAPDALNAQCNAPDALNAQCGGAPTTLNAQCIGAPTILCSASPHSFSNLIGHKSCNRQYFQARWPGIRFQYQADPALPDGVYTIFSGTIH